jgi:hypothetical protein
MYAQLAYQATAPDTMAADVDAWLGNTTTCTPVKAGGLQIITCSSTHRPYVTVRLTLAAYHYILRWSLIARRRDGMRAGGVIPWLIPAF